jgi:hypothetical protein
MDTGIGTWCWLLISAALAAPAPPLLLSYGVSSGGGIAQLSNNLNLFLLLRLQSAVQCSIVLETDSLVSSTKNKRFKKTPLP